jgi:hypothetical protein
MGRLWFRDAGKQASGLMALREYLEKHDIIIGSGRTESARRDYCLDFIPR